MNLQNILHQIEQADPEVYERVSMRRDVVRKWSKAFTLTAVPLALGSLFKTAYGRGTDVITDVLNFALTLEYLEAEFYVTGLASPTLVIPTSGIDKPALQKISADETAHVAFLKQTISALGASPVAKPNFDFTAKGTFGDVFTNYTTFLTVAQAFEDTGVRAYKGQAGNLKGNPDILTAALRIHSVEARHAAEIHLLRGVKAYNVLKSGGIPTAATDPVYAGDENTVQANIDITTLGVTASIASMAFDEPLTKAQVLSIVAPFLM